MDRREFEIAFPGAYAGPKENRSGPPTAADKQILDVYSRTIVDVVKEAGLKDIRIHDLRHTHCYLI